MDVVAGRSCHFCELAIADVEPPIEAVTAARGRTSLVGMTVLEPVVGPLVVPPPVDEEDDSLSAARPLGAVLVDAQVA